MSRQHSQNLFRQRTPTNWGVRVALACGLVAAAYFSLADTLANVVVKFDPARAHQLAVGNSVITAAYAQMSFAQNPTSSDDALSVRLARKALQRDPTTVDALTVLGLKAQLRNDAALTDHIFAYSTLLSRRELRPKIWTIEDAVTRGDIKEALRQYDLALRTSSDAQGLFFPTLTAALVEPRIRADLLRILEAKPVWEDQFINYAAFTLVNPEGASRLFAEGMRTGLVVSRDQQAGLINALFAVGKKELAWKAYARVRPAAKRDRSRDPNFVFAENTRTVFDWQVGEDPGLSAAILRSDAKTGLVDFAVPPSTGGTLVYQAELLTPGTYRLEGRSVGVDQPQRSQPYWVLACEDGRELGRIRVSNSSQNEGVFQGDFTVPQDCLTQTLSLIATPSDDISGVSGQIVRAQLVPRG